MCILDGRSNVAPLSIWHHYHNYKLEVVITNGLLVNVIHKNTGSTHDLDTSPN